jgi:hypothetical protein
MQPTADFWIAVARLAYEAALYTGLLVAMSRRKHAEQSRDEWRRLYLTEHEEVKRLLNGASAS